MYRLTDLFLFRDTEQGFAERIAALEECTPQRFEAGKVIYEPSGFQKRLGVVMSGSAKVYGGKEGNFTLLNILKEGGVFGAAAMFGDCGEYCSRIVAATGCRVVFISEELLRVMMEESPKVAVNYITFLSDRVRFLNRKIATFTADNTAGRLMQYILDKQGMQETDEVVLPVSMNKLAQALSISRASLYRAFDELENGGLIQRDGKTVRVCKI